MHHQDYNITHLRVCRVRKDSKYGCKSAGVAEIAVPINWSRSSFGGLGASMGIWADIVRG